MALLLAACAPLPPAGSPPATDPRAAAPASDDLALARQHRAATTVDWQELAPAAFARARAEGKLLLLDCVATWCHWCHVMDETTYRDPTVTALLHDRFIALRVDVDAHPDLTARYEDWGWPATVLFNPAGEELGKFRGYLAPAELRQALDSALTAQATPTPGGSEEHQPTGGLVDAALPPIAFDFLGSRLALDLDRFYDPDEGGWGAPQKLPIGANLEFELIRARHGDHRARARAIATADSQRQLLDPVWGGLYQYSTGGTWTHPHFEKRLPIQTENLEALAGAYALTREQRFLDDALRIDHYLATFLQDEAGAFLVSQDADLGGFEAAGRFVDGHQYYASDDAQRRKLGIPRIDRSVYPYENGLAIAALAVLSAVVPEPGQATALLGRARRAADLMLQRFVDGDGGVRRRPKGTPGPYFLADAAALGRGLVLLAATSGEPRYLSTAELVATAMLRRFATLPSELGPGEAATEQKLLWAKTADAAAVGVFSRRQHPFSSNVLAARFLTALAKRQGPTLANAHRARARQLLSGLATAQRLAGEGRLLGEYLLALDELAALRWQPTAR